MANPSLMNEKNIIDIVKHRVFWIVFSLLLLLPGLVAFTYSIVTNENHAPIKVGIDFTGGTILQYGTNEALNPDKMQDLRESLEKAGIKSPVIQNMVHETIADDKETHISNIVSIKTSFIDSADTQTVSKITNVINDELGVSKLIQTTSVGPTLGSELLKNSLTALFLAFLGIVAYISFRFKFDYAVTVLASLAYDTFFVISAFSILSIFFNVQVDALFITAVLTVVGASVHDTIVVFDRIRENSRFLAKKCSFGEIVNASVNQTLARSINTSVTTLLTLLALYFFGGTTTKDFVLAMILGIAIGTYSSIFFASTVLAWWHEKKAIKA